MPRFVLRGKPAIAAIALCAVAMPAAGFAMSVHSSGFAIDPAIPILDDPLAVVRNVIGYTDVTPDRTIQLPGGKPLDEFVNDFTYPPVRLGKFTFDPPTLSALFPAAGDPNGYRAVAISVTMAITDLDTNPGDIDYLDVIFALSLSPTDNGGTLARILSNKDGGTGIAPQFLTGLGNQALTDPPHVATNVYDLTGAPVLGTDLATKFSLSGGEIWLYLIDTDDSGNNISLAQSDAADFSLTVTFERAAVVPLPPALFLFATVVPGLCALARRRTPATAAPA